jgi:D-alanine--poly(phosphoribitol) ligase subunit 1
MIAAPDRVCDEIDVARFNRTDKWFPDGTIHELIEAQVARSPSRRAVVCDHDKTFLSLSCLNYAELNEKANQLAYKLREKGAGPDRIIGIMVERSFAMMIGLLGILKSGAAYLPISPENPKERINYLLNDGNVKVLLVHNKTASKVTFAGEIINLDEGAVYQGPVENPAIVNGPRDLAYVIYTSGSTGKPKGVMIEHRSVVNRLNWMQNAYPIGERDVILQKTPFFFDVSVWELFWWAFYGAKLCFLVPGGEALPLLIVETVRQHQVTIMHFVPSMLNVFLEYLAGNDARISQMASVRQVFVSGEALSPSHVKKFNRVLGQKTGARLTNLYGPTEATVDVSYFDCPIENDPEIVPIGRPIDNTRFYIIKNNQPVALGETGELCIGGVGLARGYLNNAGLTRDKFVNSPAAGERIYRTGDNARWRSDGNIEYLGREDGQVKIRGLRIELGEIENTIRNFPRVSDCVAIVKQCSENIVLIIAYVVGKEGLELSELESYLRRQLPGYMVPNRFEKIDRIPLSPSGKADRKALPETAIQARNPAAQPGAPVA